MRTSGLTYDDLLEMFPEETLQRIELIDGELLMPPGPELEHQTVMWEIGTRLHAYAKEHGGLALGGPLDVKLTDRDVVQPDVLYLLPEHAEGARRPLARVDLAVEVSSPSTRRTDTVRKRALFERHGIPEYWFVDLDAGEIVVHRLEDDRYVAATLGPGDELTSPLLPGFAARVGELLRQH